jgi:hypothetical protein
MNKINLISIITLSLVIGTLNTQSPTYTLEQNAADLTIAVTPGHTLSAGRPQAPILLSAQKVTLISKNNVGLPADDICGFAQIPTTQQNEVGAQNLVVCSSGGVFKNVGSGVAAATATPLYLSIKNYIGSIFTNLSARPGAGRQTYLCDGACQSTKA